MSVDSTLKYRNRRRTAETPIMLAVIEMFKDGDLDHPTERYPESVLIVAAMVDDHPTVTTGTSLSGGVMTTDLSVPHLQGDFAAEKNTARVMIASVQMRDRLNLATTASPCQHHRQSMKMLCCRCHEELRETSLTCNSWFWKMSDIRSSTLWSKACDQKGLPCKRLGSTHGSH